MRELGLMLLACGTLAPAPALAPKPRPASNVRVASVCPATGSCRVILSWTRPSNYTAATDTAHTLWIRSPADTLKTGTPMGTADTLLVPRPADGQASSGTARLYYTRKGWSGQASNAPVAWSVTAPVSPVDTATAVKVTGIIVKPDAFMVAARQQQQLYAFLAFASGHVAVRATDRALPGADSVYGTFPASQRAVTTAEQAVADRACFRWTATGGTISVEPCSGVPG